MDELDDEFFPLSMSGISKPGNRDIFSSQSSTISRLSKTLRKERKAVSYSQLSSVSRLSKSFRKRNARNSVSYSDITVGSTVKTINSDDLERASSNTLRFCPTCQAPFDIMKVDSNIHANQCNVNWIELEECPNGELCYSDSIFHYRDYAHKFLAQIRASKGHLETLPNTTSPNGSGSGNKKSDTFKMPLHKPMKGISNYKKRLFSDSDSVINLSSNSSKDFIIKSLNRVNNVSIDNAETKNDDCIVISEDDIQEQNESQRLKGNQIFYGPELSNKIGVNKQKRPRGEIEDIESKQNSDFQKPNKKIKIWKNCTKSVCVNVQNQDLTSAEDNLQSRDTRSFSNSQKTNRKHLTILDAVDSSFVQNLSSSGEECCVQKEKDGMCNSSTKVKNYLVEDCKNCKNLTHSKPLHNKDEQSTLEREVRAILSVVVSPTSNSSDDAKNEPETPVKVDASCDNSGWKTIGIAAPSTTEVENVKVAVCNCTKTLEVNCSLSHNQTLFDSADNVDFNNKELELKFFSHVKEPKQFNKLNAPPEPAKNQMSITSFFKTSKQPSTLSLKSSIEPASTEVRPCSSLVETQKHNNKMDCDIQEVTTSEESKQNKELAIASWKQILRGMVQKGQSTVSIMSEDSVATTTATQTSAETMKEWNCKKTCPFYKKIPDTSFVVDAFQYGYIPRITHYFLSHFHADHYGGLKKSFSYPLFCSKITAALVKMKIGVNEKYVHELELDTPRKICGVLVTALDANHCPGSVMFLFQLQDGRNFLHVGDFRADPKMESYPCFWNLTIHKLFLDTTYCEPKYDFPMQSESVARVVELAMEHHSKNPSTLFVCGTYTIGKEKVFSSIAEALNCKIWAHPDKRRVLGCIDNPIINEKLTTRQLEAQVHVCRMNDLNISFLQRYLKQHNGVFTHLVAFIPTGWEMKLRMKKDSDIISMTSYGNITIYGVPYSEHSSFTELKRFVQFLKPEEVIPTVNVGSPAKRTAMKKYFIEWLLEASQTPMKVQKQVQQKVSHYFQHSPLKKKS